MMRALACSAIALLLLVSLSACQRSVFALPPAETQACDPALIGHWKSLDDQESGDALAVTVSADCGLSGEAKQGDRMQTLEPTRLGRAEWNEQGYLWLDATWVNRNFSIETGPLDDGLGVYIYRYRVEGERLILDPPSTKALAAAIVAGEIDGDLLKQGEDWTARVRGNRANNRKALSLAMAKTEDALQLRRATAEGDGHD